MHKTSFLLGAGASVEAKLPTMAQLHTDFLRMYATPDVSTSLEDFVNAPDNTFPKHIEGLLTYLNQTATTHHDPQARRNAIILGYEIKKFILRAISKTPKDIAYLDGLRDFLHQPPLDIFTMNYDTVVETWCDHHHVPYTDGFNQQRTWDDQLFYNKHAAVRLWKLHGSITWEQYGQTLRRTKPLGRLTEELRTGELRSRTFDSVIIYPAAPKKAESVLAWLQDSFADRLRTLDNLIVIGYSFADGHINAHIAHALDGNPRLHLIICTPDPDTATDNLKTYVPAAHQHRLHPHKLTCGQALTPATLARITASITRHPTATTTRDWTPPPHQPTPPPPARTAATIPTPTGTLILRHACVKVAQHEHTIVFLDKAGTTWTLYEVEYPVPASATPRAVCDGIHDPRGIALTQDNAYIVDATIHGRYMGSGGLWTVSLATGNKTMCVGKLRPGGAWTLLRQRTKDAAPLGVLRWPTSIMVHDDRLLVTESRRIVNINPNTGVITPITTASFLNLNGIAPLSRTEVLAFEHVLSAARAPGVGAGTLWSIDLEGKRAPRVIMGGLTNARGLVTNTARTAAYVGEVQSEGCWQLVRIDLATGAIDRLAGNYAGKPAFTITRDDDLLICTPDGLYQRRAP